MSLMYKHGDEYLIFTGIFNIDFNKSSNETFSSVNKTYNTILEATNMLDPLDGYFSKPSVRRKLLTALKDHDNGNYKSFNSFEEFKKYMDEKDD